MKLHPHITFLIGLSLMMATSFCASAQSEHWEACTQSPSCEGRGETGLTELGGKLYLIGGRTIKPVEEYDPKNDSWKKLAPPPIEMHHFQALAVDGRIAVVGALTGGFPHETPIGNIWWFDPKANSWTKGEEIPEGRRRGGAGAVLHDNSIYIVCGITHGHWKGFVPWLDKMDLKTGKWTVLPDASHARDHFNAVVTDGKIVAASGRTTHGEIKKVFELVVPEVDVFDLSTGKWTINPENLPTPRAGAAGVGKEGKVVIIGGESGSQNVAHNEVEILSLSTGHWENGTPLNRGRHGMGAAILDNTIYVVSGVGNRGGDPMLDDMEKLKWQTAIKTKP